MANKRQAQPVARRGTRSRPGYTMVEVMMGLAVLAVGATGVIALQRMAVLGSMTSRHLTNATSVSKTVIEHIENEASLWVDNTGTNYGSMPWLGTALTDANGKKTSDWVAVPAASFATTGKATGFTIEGMSVVPVAANQDVAYCSHIRAKWFGNQAANANAPATDAVEIEVRTFFARSGRPVNGECALAPASMTGLFDGSSATVNDGVVERVADEYSVVYLSTVVRRN